MKIYLTDLQAYNEGYLVGKWIELPLSTDELSQALSEVLNEGETVSGTANHEEYFISDYEADIVIDEYDNIYELNELAEAMEEFEEEDYLKLKLLTYKGYNERKVIEVGLDTYEVEIYDYSQDMSFTDVYELLAQDLVEEGVYGVIPKHLENYIDYGAIGRDLAMEYTEFEPNKLGRVL